MILPERLLNLLREKGVSVSSAKPSPACKEGSPGSCARKGRCLLLGTLINQAEPGGGIGDDQLGTLIERNAAEAQAAGCNVLVKS